MTDAPLYDVVYPVRLGSDNEELRYSLRSVHHHLYHRRIYLFGAPPSWLCNVLKRPVPQVEGSFRQNTTDIMTAACLDPTVSNPFIWLNDDIFIMKRVEQVERLNRGHIDEVLRTYPPDKREYCQGMVATKNLLIDYGLSDQNILSYELHMPMIIYKRTMLYTLKLYRDSALPNLHKRTLYGNILDYGGRTIEDHKIVSSHERWERDCTYISTSDQSFNEHPVGLWIRDRFPQVSPYERIDYAAV